MDKKNLIIIILAATLFLTAQFLLLERWASSVQKQAMASYQSGYTQGSKDTIVSIYRQTENCQGATIGAANQSKTVFDASCLKKGP